MRVRMRDRILGRWVGQILICVSKLFYYDYLGNFSEYFKQCINSCSFKNSVHTHMLYALFTVPKEIDFPQYNMKCSGGQPDTTQNSSCIIMFSTTFHVISRIFGLLFGQCIFITPLPSILSLMRTRTCPTVITLLLR